MTSEQYNATIVPFLTPAELGAAQDAIAYMRAELASGRNVDPESLDDALASQYYRLAAWRDRQAAMTAPDNHTSDWKHEAELNGSDRYHLRRLGEREYPRRVARGRERMRAVMLEATQ